MTVTEFESIPTSGQFAESHFGPTDSNPLWLRVDLGTNILAFSFGRGEWKLTNKKFIQNGDTVSVLFNGAFYCIDIRTRELLFSPEDTDFIDFIYSADNSTLCLATFSSFVIFKDLNLIKVISPDFIDGIEFESATNTHIYGKLFEPGNDWTPFTLDLEWLWVESNGMTYRM